jgi:CHAT domain-containing protein
LKESEYTKARVFTEWLSRRSEGSTPQIPKDVLDEDSQLNDQLAALSKRLQDAYSKGDKEAIPVLEPQVKEVKAKLAGHVDMLRRQYPLFAAIKYPQPMGLDQTALQDNEWVLAYHVTDTGIIIYLTKGKTLVKGLFKPTPRKDIDELVRNFREPMELVPDEDLKQKLNKFDFKSGKKLSDLLLADILPDLPQNTPVIIIPDGSLGVVPFEMLVLNDGGKVTTDKKRPQTSDTEFFGDRNPASYYQSITALTLARTLGKQQKQGEKLLAMVDPVFSSDDPRLVKLAKQEKARMLATLPKDLTMSIQTDSGLTFPRLPLTAELGESLKKSDPSRTDLLEGMTAKKSVLLGKDLTPYRSLVFGTHGYFGKDLPGIQEPVLVLSLLDQPNGQDGFLRLSEVMALKLNCDIAALTACQTGLGRHISGEGTMGMGRAFQYAGAKSVLMSLWSVSETASVNLVENFFKHTKEGKSKLEALILAREEIRKAGYDHPFYWAPFILVGEVD